MVKTGEETGWSVGGIQRSPEWLEREENGVERRLNEAGILSAQARPGWAGSHQRRLSGAHLIGRTLVMNRLVAPMVS